MEADSYKYYKTIFSKYKVLTKDEEMEMRKKYEKDLPKLRELLVLHNLGLAFDLSKKYSERSEMRDDIVSRAVSGIVMAAHNFDFNAETRFASYCGYFIKLAMQDLFNYNLSSARIQSMTSAIMDEKIDDEDDGSKTIGDFISLNGASPDWESPNYGKPISMSDDFALVISDIIERYVKKSGDKNTEAAFLYFFKDMTIEEIALHYAITIQRAHQLVVAGRVRIYEHLRNSPIAKDARYIFDNHHVRTGVKDGRDGGESMSFEGEDADKLRGFMDENGIVLALDGNTTSEDMVAVEMDLFDRACYAQRRLMGRTGEGYTFPPLMRRVYELAIANGNDMNRVKHELNAPMPYLMYLLSEAVNLVDRYKKGLLKERTKGEEVPRETKCNKNKAVRDGEASLYGGAANYSRMSSGRPLVRNEKRVYVNHGWHCKPFRGGFYSEWQRYHGKDGLVVMDKTQLAINVMLGNITPKFATLHHKANTGKTIHFDDIHFGNGLK